MLVVLFVLVCACADFWDYGRGKMLRRSYDCAALPVHVRYAHFGVRVQPSRRTRAAVRASERATSRCAMMSPSAPPACTRLQLSEPPSSSGLLPSNGTAELDADGNSVWANLYHIDMLPAASLRRDLRNVVRQLRRQGHRSRFTVLLYADSVHRIGLTAFCNHTEGTLGGYPGVKAGDYHGTPLRCRWMFGDMSLSFVWMIQYGVALTPPYHHKFATDHRVHMGSGRTLVADTVPRFVRTLDMLKAAGEHPDMIVMNAVMWDWLRLEQLGRNFNDFLVESRVESWFGTDPTPTSMRLRTEFVDSWRRNASAILRDVGTIAGNETLLVWQGSALLPQAHFMSQLGDQHCIKRQARCDFSWAQRSYFETMNALASSIVDDLASRVCVQYFDVPKMLRHGDAKRWWSSQTRPIDPAKHMLPVATDALYLTLLNSVASTVRAA